MDTSFDPSANWTAFAAALQPVPEGEAQPFPDEQALLALLHRLAAPSLPHQDDR